MKNKILNNLDVLLVVEDTRQGVVYNAILEMSGCTVKAAADSDTALNMLQQHRFDIVLIDTAMRATNGLALARLISDKQASGKLADDMPLIAITEDDLPASERLCREAGMADIIPKHHWENVERFQIDKTAVA